MTQIKKILDKQGNEVFIRTSTKAVVDSNGYTAESRLQAMQDEINQAQLEIGAVPSDLTPTEGSTNWVTSGGLYNQLNVGVANTEIDLTQYEDVAAALTSSTQKWTTSASSKFIPIVPNGKYKIVAGETTVIYAFLTSNVAGANNTSVTTYATNSTTQTLNNGAEVEVIAPDDAAYLNVTSVDSSENDRLPRKIVKINKKNVGEVILNTETTPTKNSENLITSGGVKDALEQQYDSIYNDITLYNNKEIDLTQYTAQKAYIASNNCWSPVDGYYGLFIPVSANNYYKITSGNNSSVFAFLTTDDYTANGSVSFADGASRTKVAAGNSVTAKAPHNAMFLWVSYQRGEVSGLPKSIEIVHEVLVSDFLTELFSFSELNVSNYPKKNAWINISYSKWYIGSNKSIFIPTSVGIMFRIYGSENRSKYTFLTSDVVGADRSSVTTYATGYNQVLDIAPDDYVTVSTPSDAKFLWVGIHSSTVDITPTKIEKLDVNKSDNSSVEASTQYEMPVETKILAEYIANPLYPRQYNLNSDGYEIAGSRQELAVQKKAKLATKIKWTPLNNVPNNSGTFNAGVEVVGIPYSSVQSIDKYVGQDVSLHTFMTAVNNPYSLLYTENVNESSSTSAWGKTYHGNNCAAYYGMVCSSFACYCNGMSLRWVTVEDAWLDSYYPKMVKIYDQSAQGLKIGDIYWLSGHNRLISGLKRDSNGNVTHVIVSEAMGKKVIENNPITANAFNTKLSSEDAIIYRCTEMYKNVWNENEFIEIADDLSVTYKSFEYNDDICIFAGDKACFREGDTIVIDYNLKNVGTWTSMELYKNDSLLETISISSQEHYVNLTDKELGYGQYKARLTDGSNYSEYTYFEIIQTGVNYIIDGSNITVSYQSSNGTPMSVMICVLNGATRAHYELSNKDINNGSVVFNFVELNKQQKPSNLITSSVDYYLKVYFKGSYGRVTNEPILLNL